MSTIVAEVQEAAAYQGRASYDPTAGILEIPLGSETRWSQGVDIDGRLIFDMADDGTVENMDLLVPRTRWTEGVVAHPLAAREGRLVIDPVTLARKSIHMPLKVITDNGRSVALILLGSENAMDGQWVRLSRDCSALLGSGSVLGFFVKVPSTRPR